MSSAGSSTSSSSAPVKRACDSCHRRKVKCIGEGTRPCKNCVTAGLTCTYNAIPQKKGPKGSRAKVLSELRETQRQTQFTASASQDQVFGGRSLSPALSRTPGLLPPELIDYCIDYFFANLYPTQPILHRGSVQQAVAALEYSTEAYCKITALCAYIMVQPNIVLPPNLVPVGPAGPISPFSIGHTLLEESRRVRKGYDFLENPTILTLYTSYFIFMSYFCLDKQNTAWTYLRQATTLSHIMGLHKEEAYKHGVAVERSRKRRLYWLLFITERSYAFKSHRPLSLYATISLPAPDEDPTDTVPLTGFIHLVNLYKPFDETFFGLWNKVLHVAAPTWLAQLQEQLRHALPAYLESTGTQLVDLQMSQQWLKTMVWQLAISHNFISSLAKDTTMCFKYPIEISRDLVEMSAHFSRQAMEVHGIGFVEKLFDVAYTLTDVMVYVPMEQQTFQVGPRDYLNRFVELISSLRAGQSKYLPLLLSKIGEVLPNMQFPMAHALPMSESSRPHIEELYNNPSSGQTSHEETPLESPPHPPVPLRHGSSTNSHSGMQYAEIASNITPPLASSYQTFSTAIGYPEVASTTASSAQGLYQPHYPHDFKPGPSGFPV